MAGAWSRSTTIGAIFSSLDASLSGSGEQLLIVKRTILDSLLHACSDEQLMVLVHRMANLAPTETGEDFPGWVKSCRLSLGLTQAQLADALKLSQSDLSNLESRSSRLKIGSKRRARIKTQLNDLISKK